MQCFLVHWSRHNISSKHCKEHTPFPHSSRSLKTQGQDVVYLVPSRLSSQLADGCLLCPHMVCLLCSPTEEKNALCLSLLLCHQSHHEQSPKTIKKRPHLQCHSTRRVGGLQLHYIVEVWSLLTAVAGYVTWILSQMTTLSSFLLLGKVLCPTSIQC